MLKMVGVETFYGKVKALHGVSLDVKEGQLVTILGANGAGKSTILKTISGLVEPENGTIHFNDIRIDRKDPEDIVAMGISHVPEWRRIFPELTVYENLLMGGFLIKERDLLHARMEEAYLHFPVLRNRKEQRAGTLSGGEQQMVATARALCIKPKYLLMDEPSEGLMPSMIETILRTIEKLKKENVGILLVEQKIEGILRVSDRITFIENGFIRDESDPQKLKKNPESLEKYVGLKAKK